MEKGINRPEGSADVLVTGASGFVGRNLVEDLLDKGLRVRCLVRNTSDTTELRQLPVGLIKGDLLDIAVLRKAVENVNTVYHVAGAIKAPDRAFYFEVNQAGTRRLLEAAADRSPRLKRFIYVSSLAAAGPSPNGRGLTEDAEPNPISWYGESKLAAEHEVLRFSKCFPVTIVRPSAVYGPHDRETLMIFRMVKSGCLFTPGRFTRLFSLIHVRDLVAGLIRAGETDTLSGEIYYISRPEIYSWDDVGHAIARAVNKTYRRIAFPKQLALMAGRAGDLWSSLSGRAVTVNSQKVKELLQPSWICDCSKALKCLGFVPEITMEKGMPETVRWYQVKGWL